MRRFAIVDDSMRPQFEPGDWVMAIRRCGVPRRGEVVIFTHPSHPGRFLIKRTIGLPGERVSAADGRIHIDERVLADPWGDRPINTVFDIRVPAGTVWVVGDNRSGPSVDSRVLDAIPLDDVGWKVVARYWPPSRAGRIDT
jgi:signal peptidase I